MAHWVGKYFCQSDLKSYDCLVTHWVAITLILLIIWEKFLERVQTPLSQKCITFSQFLLKFCNQHKIFAGFHKKDQVHSLNISEVIDSLPEMWLLECPKVPVLEHPFRGNVLTGIKDCWNHHISTFILNFHWPKTHWVGKHLCW